MSKFFYFLIVFFIIWTASSYSTLIMKVNNKKALIHLQGVKTYEGAFFKVYNLDNKKTGLLKIDKVAQTKAIGTLKTGSMSKKWRLKPVSKRTALVELKKAVKRQERLALIQKEKMKRRIARKKAMEKRRRLAQKKKSLSRKVASFTLKEDVLEGLDGMENNMQQSQEILSYSNNSNETEGGSYDSPNYPKMEVAKIEETKEPAGYFELGLNLNPQFNYMQIKLEPQYHMTGLGGSAHLQALFSYNSFLEIGAGLGYRYFSVSTPEGSCPRDEGCSLLVHYLSSMAHLKFNILHFNKHKLWFMTEGSLMLPIAFRDRVPNLNSAVFKTGNLHGSIGAGLGFDFKVGSWVIPVSFNGSFHMPHSQTTTLLTGGLQTGFRYQF